MIPIKRSLLLLCLSLGFSLAYGLTSDSQAKLFISADNADLNSQTGVGVYQGNVLIDQGSTHVRGNTVTSYSKNNKISEVLVKGTPEQQARYESTPDADKPPLVATADTIQFYPDRKYAILIGNAHVQQGKNSIIGEHIEYDLTHKILKSMNSAGTKPARTQIVIDPNDLPKTD